MAAAAGSATATTATTATTARFAAYLHAELRELARAAGFAFGIRGAELDNGAGRSARIDRGRT